MCTSSKLNSLTLYKLLEFISKNKNTKLKFVDTSAKNYSSFELDKLLKKKSTYPTIVLFK